MSSAASDLSSQLSSVISQLSEQSEVKQQSEIEVIATKVRQSQDPTLGEILSAHDLFLKKTVQEIQYLLSAIQEALSHKSPAEIEQIKTKTYQKIEQELILVDKLNALISDHSPTGDVKVLAFEKEINTEILKIREELSNLETKEIAELASVEDKANKLKALRESKFEEIIERYRAHRLSDLLLPYLMKYKEKIGIESPKCICNIPLKYNKLKESLKGAKEFLDKFFVGFNLPGGYGLEVPAMTVLGNNGQDIYGSSKATFLKTALLYVFLNVSEKNKLSELKLPKQANNNLSWIDDSTIVHIVSLPISLSLERLKVIDKRFEDCCLLYSDTITLQGIVTIHSGYAFGGHRAEFQRYPNGKLFGPEDCSSGIAKIIGCPKPITTADLWFYYNAAHNPIFREYPQYKEWSKGNERKAIDEVLTTVHPIDVQEDPQKAIIPGMVFAYVNFDLTQDLFRAGTSKYTGHVVVALGCTLDKKKVIGLGWNRDMPNVEGLGVQEYELNHPARRTMFFSRKPTLSQPVSASQNDLVHQSHVLGLSGSTSSTDVNSKQKASLSS